MIPSRTTPPPPASQQSKSKVSFSQVGEQKGQRILLYGTGGVGKSTLACLIEGQTAFVDLDESLPILKKQLKGIGATIPKIVTAGSWQDIRSALQSDGWDGIQNIVIDTVTKLEELCIKHVLKTVKNGNEMATSVEDYGYGKGYQFVYETFRLILGDFDRHVRAGRNIILIAHECAAKVPNPNGEDWIRYEPRLQTTTGGKASIRLGLKEWADHVLFLAYDVDVSKKGKAQGAGSRTLYVSELPTFMAKSRTGSGSINIEHGVSPWAEILQ